MINLMLMMTLSMSFVFLFLGHPLSMGVSLLIQAILISMITGMLSHSFCFSYILFMIMIGGMLVLFIYMTSVASNEKSLYSNKLLTLSMITLSSIATVTMMDSFPSYVNSMNMDMLSSSINPMFHLSLSSYVNLPSNWIMISTIIFLLVTLIAVVKITNISYRLLRQKP